MVLVSGYHKAIVQFSSERDFDVPSDFKKLLIACTDVINFVHFCVHVLIPNERHNNHYTNQ